MIINLLDLRRRRVVHPPPSLTYQPAHLRQEGQKKEALLISRGRNVASAVGNNI